MNCSYWIGISNLLSEEELCDIDKYVAYEGNSPDKVASIVIKDNNLLLQCDKYTLSIVDGKVHSNCCTDNISDAECFNTLSSALLANKYLNQYIHMYTDVNTRDANNLITHIMTKMDKKMAAIILNVLMYDMYLFINATK